jgi:hypothetical protein
VYARVLKKTQKAASGSFRGRLCLVILHKRRVKICALFLLRYIEVMPFRVYNVNTKKEEDAEMKQVREYDSHGLYEDVIKFTRAEKTQIRNLGKKYGSKVTRSRYGSYYMVSVDKENKFRTVTIRVSDHPTGFSAEYYGHCDFNLEASDYERERDLTN